MAERPAPYSHFRLNFEQQQKRAKDLLKAARAGDQAALARFKSSPPKLAEAQHAIARELRFDDWAHLKRHIAAMARERAALEADASRTGASTALVPARNAAALDGDMRTLHVRCGSDIRRALLTAGFRGDFYEHGYPYLAGPVREAPGSLEQRARFLVESYADSHERLLEHAQVLEGLRRDEQLLHDSAEYDRVVIWSELDCYDQLVLVRLLGHYARHRRPPRLDLINVGAFPGGTRFVGLGQLPPEALRMLWRTRRAASPAQLRLGLEAWQALASPDPRRLAALMRTGTPALPLLAPALHRHLRELPSVETGLSLTEEMALELLAEQERSIERIFVLLNSVVDPLPGQGDLEVCRRVLMMERASAAVFTRHAGVDRHGEARPPWTDVLAITELGRSVLRGEVDFRSLEPPARWAGGVEVGRGKPDWRWDESRKDVRLYLRGNAS